MKKIKIKLKKKPKKEKKVEIRHIWATRQFIHWVIMSSTGKPQKNADGSKGWYFNLSGGWKGMDATFAATLQPDLFPTKKKALAVIKKWKLKDCKPIKREQNIVGPKAELFVGRIKKAYESGKCYYFHDHTKDGIGPLFPYQTGGRTKYVVIGKPFWRKFKKGVFKQELERSNKPSLFD